MSVVSDRLSHLDEVAADHLAAALDVLDAVASEVVSRFSCAALEVTFEPYEGFVSDVRLLGGGPLRPLQPLDAELDAAARKAAEAVSHHRGYAPIRVSP